MDTLTQAAPANPSATTAVLLCNLGTPEAPTASALRRYLAEFLSDRRVVEIPPIIWQPILRGFILPSRPRRSAAKYKSIWQEEGSPLLVGTRRQAQALQDLLGHDIVVRFAMRYGQPSIASQLDVLRSAGVEKFLILPAYPQYAAATTASVFDAVAQWGQRTRALPEFRFVNSYAADKGYINALAQSVRAHWASQGRSDMLVMSFHGIPERSVLRGDPYQAQCMTTAGLLAHALALSPAQYRVTFQSRFGKAKWLAPYTEPALIELAKAGVPSVDLICPGFSCDCLETLEEINLEARAAFMQHGGKSFRYIACLNDDAPWIQALAAICKSHLGV